MRKLATAAFSYSAAVLAAVYFLPEAYHLYIAVCLAVLGCVSLAVKGDFGKRLLIIFVSAALGLTWTRGYYQLFRQGAELYEKQSMSIAAEVTNYSEILDYGTKVSADIVIDGRRYNSLLYFYDREVALSPGDVISCNATVSCADKSWGEKTLYYASNGYILKAYCGDAPNVYTPEKTSLRFYPAIAAKAVTDKLDALYNDFDSAFMKALIMGDDSSVSDDFSLDVEKTGLTHVFVVSGLHIGFLMSIISLLARRRRLTAAIGIPIIVFFAAMSGFTASVCRASLMYILVLVAPLFYRESDGLTNISLALLVLLLINPYAIANIALQLSFSSCLGMTLFSPAIYKWLQKSRPMLWLAAKLPFTRGKSNPIVNFVLASLSSSIGVLVPSTPILSLHFGFICVISPLSNLLAIWAFSLCFCLGLVSVVLGFIFLPLGKVAAMLPVPIIGYVRWIVGLLSKAPFATVTSSFFTYRLWLIFVYAVIVFSFVFKAKRPYVQIGCCAVTFLAAYLFTGMYINGSNLMFSALDTGQGQCLVASSKGETVVIDCGGNNSPDDALYSHLRTLGTSDIDMLIVTHYHGDHAEYVPSVLRSAEVETLVLPDVEDDTGLRQAIVDAAADTGTEVLFLSSDAFVEFGVSTIEIFGPMGGDSANEQCLSMVISFENYDILVTADMDEGLENLLLATKRLPDIEVLMVGHHGSKRSTGDRLLAETSPETAIISVGSNSYGHPADETLKRLDACGINVLRTDILGDVTIRK